VETLINLIVSLVLTACVVSLSQVASCGFGSTAVGICTPLWAVAWIIAGAMLALMVYRGACFAMEVLAGKMVSLVDTYRLTALAQLGFAPETVGEELATLRQLKGFFTQAKKLDPSLKLTRPKSEAKGEAEAKDKHSEKPEGNCDASETSNEPKQRDKEERSANAEDESRSADVWL